MVVALFSAAAGVFAGGGGIGVVAYSGSNASGSGDAIVDFHFSWELHASSIICVHGGSSGHAMRQHYGSYNSGSFISRTTLLFGNHKAPYSA